VIAHFKERQNVQKQIRTFSKSQIVRMCDCPTLEEMTCEEVQWYRGSGPGPGPGPGPPKNRKAQGENGYETPGTQKNIKKEVSC